MRSPFRYGKLMLTPEVQADFVTELPSVFLPVASGWGKNGATHVRLSEAIEDLLAGALRNAWKIRLDKNAQAGRPPSSSGVSGRKRKPRGRR